MHTQHLDQLPQTLIDTFKEPFVFIISPEVVQHFPARNWDKEQMIAKLHELLGETLLFDHWHRFLIATNPSEKVIVLMPGFEKFFEETK